MLCVVRCALCVVRCALLVVVVVFVGGCLRFVPCWLCVVCWFFFFVVCNVLLFFC